MTVGPDQRPRELLAHICIPVCVLRPDYATTLVCVALRRITTGSMHTYWPMMNAKYLVLGFPPVWAIIKTGRRYGI